MIYGLATPFFITATLMTGMLQCSGNMKFPAIMNASMCFMDIAFNFLFIYILGFGVKGAALGTAASAVVTTIIMSAYTIFKSEYLTLKGHKDFSLNNQCIKKAVKIGAPIAVESSAFTGALVVVARMIAPLGSVALSANSFATTAEALCYMPGYGIQEAATTLVGQSVGAPAARILQSPSQL